MGLSFPNGRNLDTVHALEINKEDHKSSLMQSVLPTEMFATSSQHSTLSCKLGEKREIVDH